ncbi:protein-disulfide reductase DsbD domain-containing protein [Sulfitobacter aestuariivivens]|uniref:Thiol:disulfide interchange protein DsbD N-terminal domain-containing protein n=1 Tax=Sulfitobacter aestuariivivens TaxID=2766981 RepID=A0A927D741_9RHOB|nr:protein-disulfide reductase DsbD domain-containing protein [Sulfitobacter aestuariivivens]MBD3664437.1 hypothetical protein [Sulfitobacter aestuariivivens]
MIRSLTALFLLALCLIRPAWAQSDIGTPATGEILPGWVQQDGTHMAAIRIKLQPGWKTYWRSPGDAGIPPQFNWQGSSNLGDVRIIWPAPLVIPQNGMQTIGYKDVLVLPLAVAPRNQGQPVDLRLQLNIGVCEDICVPFDLSLQGTLTGNDTRPTPAIVAALAARPYSGSEAGVSAATCRLRPNDDGLEITAQITMPPAGGREVVIIEPGQTGIWTSETDARRAGQQLIAVGDMVPTRGTGIAIDRSKITLTVLGRDKAVEIKGCTPG